MRARPLVLAALLLACREPRPPLRDAAADVPARPRVDVARVDAPGVPDATPDVPARPRRLTVTLGGDILLTPRVMQNALARRENGRLVALLGPVAPLLSFQTIAFANLRTPLGGEIPPDLARDLARVGFDVLLLANDRSGDRGRAGLRETLEAVRAARMLGVGVNDGDDGPFAPVIVEREGVRVAFVGCTARLQRDPGGGEHDPRVALLREDPQELIGAVTAARSVADVVVAGVTWPRDRGASPNEGLRALAQRLVDAGADIVAGFGQPTLGPVAKLVSPRGEAVVAYALGTLLSHHGSAWHLGTSPAQVSQNPWVYDPALRDGAMLHVTLDLATEGVVRVAGLRANAVWTSHLDDEIRVVPMRGVDERVATERLRAIAAALGPAVRVRP